MSQSPHPVHYHIGITAPGQQAAVWERVMLAAWQRILPAVLAGLLVFNLLEAITIGGRGNWLTAAIIALLLAFTLWRRRRAEP